MSVSDSFLQRLQDAQAYVHAHHENCVFCYLEQSQVTRYLTGVANDGVNNIPLRVRLQKRGGYCATHNQQFATVANVLSSAILFDAFTTMHLERAAAGKRPLRVDCEACEVKTTTRTNFMTSLKAYRKSNDVQAFIQNTPLCLTHVTLVCRYMPPAVRQTIIARHAPLRRDLQELIRKHDYRFSDETISEKEAQSVKHILEFFES